MSKSKWGSLGLSLLILVALVLWMASGDVKVSRDSAPEQRQTDRESLPSVQVDTRQSRLYEPGLLLQGQLEPWRSVTIGARVSGTVEELLVQQGDRVSTGDPLLRLSEDSRQVNVERARARLRQLEADLAAARRLRANDLASQADILNLESELASARADLKAAQLELDNLTPEAPFDSIVNRRHVNVGNLVQVGEPLMELVQVDRLKATGQVPQQSVGSVREGQRVRIDLLDGDTLEGTVSFIASAADPQTRSFSVEVSVENPGEKRVAGGSATLRIALPEVQAMFLSPAFLALGDDGRPGVRHVDDDGRVAFTTVRLLNVTTEGAWVTGLPDEIQLITRGGGFVSIGQQVRPLDIDSDRG